MNGHIEGLPAIRTGLSSWSWMKKSLVGVAALGFLTSSFLFLTPPGHTIREKLAETVMTTQHREWAWIFVGAKRRDEMVQAMHDQTESMGKDHLNLSLIQHQKRTTDQLIKIEDISGKYWKGKKIYVYDPASIRVVVPNKAGEGERITSMVQRTGAVMGVNGGGFVDPDGLGNGFAPIGFIMSGGSLLYTDQDGSIPQHVVGFTDEGTLVVGKYSIDELEKLHVKEAVSFYPRVIADGKPLITSGDGGWGRGPRTAVGQKADGTVIFVVIDGRQASSVGATLREVQDLLLADGCVNAGFLDGGASSEMVANNQLQTSPSSRYGERRLPSAFLVFDNPDSYKADHTWDGLTTIDPGGAYDHPDYLREQAELKAKQDASTSKPTTTPTPTPTKSSTSSGSSAHTSSQPSATPNSTASSGSETTQPTESPSTSAAPGTSASQAPAQTPSGAATSLPASSSPSASSTGASAPSPKTTSASK